MSRAKLCVLIALLFSMNTEAQTSSQNNSARSGGEAAKGYGEASRILEEAFNGYEDNGTKCPASNCTVCGKNRQMIYTTSGPSQNENERMASLLQMNKNTCHIWKEKQTIYGCMTATTCENTGKHVFHQDCSKNIKSASECENWFKSAFRKIGCDINISCEAKDSQTTPISCVTSSELCQKPIRDESARSILEMKEYRDYCPAGTKRMALNHFLKRQLNIVHSELQADILATPDSYKDVFCKWDEATSSKGIARDSVQSQKAK